MDNSPFQNVPCTPLLSSKRQSNYSPVAVVPQSVTASSSAKCLWFSTSLPKTPTPLLTSTPKRLNAKFREVPSMNEKSSPNMKKDRICPDSLEIFLRNTEKDQQVPCSPSSNGYPSSTLGLSSSKNREELSKSRNLTLLPQMKEKVDHRKTPRDNSNLDLFDRDDFFL